MEDVAKEELLGWEARAHCMVSLWATRNQQGDITEGGVLVLPLDSCRDSWAECRGVPPRG